MEFKIVRLKESDMTLSDLLLRLVLPVSRELKWSCPSVRFITLVPFLERLIIKRLENVLRVLNVILLIYGPARHASQLAGVAGR